MELGQKSLWLIWVGNIWQATCWLNNFHGSFRRDDVRTYSFLFITQNTAAMTQQSNVVGNKAAVKLCVGLNVVHAVESSSDFDQDGRFDL